MQTKHLRLSDIRGLSRLAVQATVGVNDLVEAMHHTILALPAPLAAGPHATPRNRTHATVYRVLRGGSAAVYGSIRGITQLLGGGLDAALRRLQPEIGHLPSSREREAMLAILNGVLGDHLHNNPLCIAMAFRQGGQPLVLKRAALAQAYPAAQGELLVLLHGHCMNELQWAPHDDAPVHTLTARPGQSTLWLHYNTGRHISHNGRALAAQLEALVQAWPVPVRRLRIVGFSMGGLLARSAVYHAQRAGHRWPQLLAQLFFVGTPHHGSMVERAGNLVDLLLEASPYSRALARLGKIRSAGTTDLRHGNLRDEDWQAHDRFAVPRDTRTPVPLPAGVRCYAIAGVAQPQPQPDTRRSQWVGDGLVPLASALGRHPDPAFDLHLPPQHQHTFFSTTHLGLLKDPAVFDLIARWMEEPVAPAAPAPRSA